MKFLIQSSDEIGKQQLVYLEDECSFYMEYTSSKIELELIVNKISLAVLDNRITDLSGFCGLDKSMKSNYQIPKYRKGILSVEHNLNYGLAYGINDEDLPVHVNMETGWVCIGNPNKKGNAVEFINNCVAVIDDDKEFVSLWLKPKILPDL